jgi:hypothetical protein
MNRLAPIGAMLWENWRLTRVEVAMRLAQNLVAAAAAVIVFDAGAKVVFWILVAGSAFIFFSIAKLNGGRFMDGYKPGFPLYLLYTRPVPTSLLVGVAMAYDALSHVVLYVFCAALLGFAFDIQLPLFSMAIFLVTCHVTYFCIQYATTSRIVQWVGSMAFSLPLFFLLLERVSTPLQVEFSLIENTVMGLVCLACYGLTVAGVARQRRGEPIAIAPQPAPASGHPDWLVNLVRIPCPTSSPVRAQIWFELKSSGIPLMTIGLSMALATFVLYALSIAFAPVRPAAIAAPIFFGLPALVLLLGGNAFGIRRKQGRTYVSPFEATQPYDTAQLVSVKVLVRAACLLFALIAVGLSLWASSSLMNAWEAWVPDGQSIDAKPGLLKMRQQFGATLGGLTGPEVAALAVIVSVVVILVVAWLATFKALRTRYPRPVLVTGVLLLLHGIALILLSLAANRGLVSQALQLAVFAATEWIAAAAIIALTVYLFWNGFARRALTIPYVCGAALIAAGFAAAFLSQLPAGKIAEMFWPVVVILLISALAPWSLHRLRHA